MEADEIMLWCDGSKPAFGRETASLLVSYIINKHRQNGSLHSTFILHRNLQNSKYTVQPFEKAQDDGLQTLFMFNNSSFP